jgi:hypothetical protein
MIISRSLVVDRENGSGPKSDVKDLLPRRAVQALALAKRTM